MESASNGERMSEARNNCWATYQASSNRSEPSTPARGGTSAAYITPAASPASPSIHAEGGAARIEKLELRRLKPAWRKE
jgi:hypothetical protein